LIIPLTLVLGGYAGWKLGRWPDRAVSSWALVFLGVPEFVTGAILAYLVGVSLGLFPPVALLPPGDQPWMHPDVLVLPVLTLVIAALPYGVWYVRSAVVASLDTEYVQMARVNGIPERRILWRYALRNALTPSIQVITLMLLYLVGGVVVAEAVFQYPGLGLLAVDSTVNRDTPTIQAVVLIIGAIYVLITVANDLLAVLVTPKLRTRL
jgi:peptide/nickel transport system permease protein